MESTLVTSTVKDFMTQNGFTQVVRIVKESQNHYPFVTFITADNKAENVYFSKNASKLVSAGVEIVKGFFDKFSIANIENAAGEKRIKLVSQGEGLRLNVDDLF